MTGWADSDASYKAICRDHAEQAVGGEQGHYNFFNHDGDFCRTFSYRDEGVHYRIHAPKA